MHNRPGGNFAHNAGLRLIVDRTSSLQQSVMTTLVHIMYVSICGSVVGPAESAYTKSSVGLKNSPH
jgi:hypothetical protein